MKHSCLFQHYLPYFPLPDWTNADRMATAEGEALDAVGDARTHLNGAMEDLDAYEGGL